MCLLDWLPQVLKSHCRALCSFQRMLVLLLEIDADSNLVCLGCVLRVCVSHKQPGHLGTTL